MRETFMSFLSGRTSSGPTTKDIHCALLGVFSSAEGPQDKNTFGKTVQMQV
jgi:hypothetical protein